MSRVKLLDGVQWPDGTTQDSALVPELPVDHVLFNGILKNYNPPSGINNVSGINFDPTGQTWVANEPGAACPQGSVVTTLSTILSPFDTIWTSLGVNKDAGFGRVVKSSSGGHYFCANLLASGTSGGSEPSPSGNVDDTGVHWSASEVFTGAWQSSHTYTNNELIRENGFIWRAIGVSGATGGTEPNWASVSEAAASINDPSGNLQWSKRGRDAGVWAATTLYGITPTADHTTLWRDYVTYAADATKATGFGYSLTGTFGTNGASEPAWSSAANDSFWLSGNVIYIHGSDLFGANDTTGNERLVITGLATPTLDGKRITITNSGSLNMSIVLADKSRIIRPGDGAAGTDADSTKGFDFGGKDLVLQAGQSATVVYDATNSEWTGTKAEQLFGGSGVVLFYKYQSGTFSGDPGDGFIGGSTTIGFATSLRLDDLDAYGADVSAIVDTFDDSTNTIKGHITLYRPDDWTKWVVYTVSAVTNSTGYRTVTVSAIARSQSSPFSPNQLLCAAFTRAGDAGAGGGDTSSDTATSVDAEIALFKSTTGKLIKRATGTGIVKVTSGVMSIAAAGTDYEAHDADLTTIAGLTATTDNFMIAVASAWASRTPAQAKTTLALVKADVGLGSVDNTADSAKVVATAAALTTARNIDGQSFNGSADITVIAPGTHAATSKATPVDADEVPLVDSAASNVLKRLTWANLKATLKTYLDTLYQPVDSDLTTIAGLTATTDNFIVSVASAWASRTPAQVKTTLALNNVDNTSNATERAATATLTNKRVTKRSSSTAGPGATPSINTDNLDIAVFTALATAITSMTTNLTGTPTEGQTLWIAFTDNGTARAITWGASFEASTVALPITTVISTRLDVGFVWNVTTSKWRCIAKA